MPYPNPWDKGGVTTLEDIVVTELDSEIQLFREEDDDPPPIFLHAGAWSLYARISFQPAMDARATARHLAVEEDSTGIDNWSLCVLIKRDEFSRRMPAD